MTPNDGGSGDGQQWRQQRWSDKDVGFVAMLCRVVDVSVFYSWLVLGLSGLDGRLLTARPSPKVADLGFVGEVARVDPTILCSLIDTNHIPVVTSVAVAVEDSGQPYNINADTVAGELAAALGARS
ncbi:hypothetical protein LR48_Vigan05g147200 [Vigna angularis]|uniref:Aspartate/glutamate/uridylate kinase domain-containing protein n=1 Tax=Phaseolus angularis TaxID=3914 RepID=A0A0L9UMR2_PHAAN|nr:hypothetical protein LR48_Vigan05g147200 [Vigna angularis]